MAFLFSMDFLEDSRFGSRCLRPANRTRQLKAALAAYMSKSCKKVVSRPRAMVVVPLSGPLLETLEIGRESEEREGALPSSVGRGQGG